MKRLLCVVSMLFLLGMLSAQEDNWHVYRPGFTAYDICCLNGELWVSSSAGIMRWNPNSDLRIQYDNLNTPYPHFIFPCICAGADGAVYAGGNHGVMRFSDGIWQLFNTENSGLISNEVSKILAAPDGGVWIGTNLGLSYYRQGVWRSYTSSNSTLPPDYVLYDLALDSQRGLWAVTTAAVHYYNGTNWTVHTPQNSTLPSQQVHNISFGADGIGWFGLSEGVAKYTAGTWQRFTSLDGVTVREVKGSHIDPLRRVWLWDADTLWLCGADFRHYSVHTFGVHYMKFARMVMDEDYTIWLGLFDQTNPNTLVRFDGTDFIRYPVCELPLPNRAVQEVFRGFDDKLWIATSGKYGSGGYLSIGEDGIHTFGRYNTAMPCPHVWSLAQDRELNIWVGTCIGLLKTGPSGSELFQSSDTGIGGSYTETICPVGDGVWIGNIQGVSRYENGIWTPLTASEAGLNLAHTRMIKTDPYGRIWIAAGAGVCCYVDSQFTVYPQIKYGRDFAFGENDEVWVARGELSRFQNGEWTHFNDSNSDLPANTVISVAMDLNNVLWIGMIRSDPILLSFDGESFSGFNSQNSPINSIGILTIFVDEDNSKWIGEDFLYRYNEDGLDVSNAEQIVPPAIKCLNYPNPFKTSTTIRVDKIAEGPLHIKIYNMKGQLLWTHTGSDTSPKEISWNGKDKHGQDCATGIYLIRVQDGAGSRTHKALKLK